MAARILPALTTPEKIAPSRWAQPPDLQLLESWGLDDPKDLRKLASGYVWARINLRDHDDDWHYLDGSSDAVHSAAVERLLDHVAAGLTIFDPIHKNLLSEEAANSGEPRAVVKRDWIRPPLYDVLDVDPGYWDDRQFLQAVSRLLKRSLNQWMSREEAWGDAAERLTDEHAVSATDTAEAITELELLSRAACVTDRESEIIQLRLAGYDYGEIADKLGISTTTARNHYAHAIQKLRRAASA
jgi:RNA polymerase sigma factor (sigma-70 family)